MSHRKKLPLKARQAGFTIVELLIVIVIIGIAATGAAPFFSNVFNQYLLLHQDSTQFSDVAIQTQRIATVLRSATDITAISNSDITLYAYFVPNDTYVSLIHYYLNNTNDKMLADVTPMTANPPIGSPITASKQTFTIINNFYLAGGVNTFTYLDDTGATLSLPISDLHTIKGIQVTLATPRKTSVGNSNNTVNVQVSLRNRKTNL